MPKQPLIILLSISLVLFVHPASVSADNGSTRTPSISLSIDHGDGGRQSDRHMRSLLTALNNTGCQALGNQASAQLPAQLHFDPQPASKSELNNLGYRLIARAITLQGESTVRGAILVHASTGIRDVASLAGQRISFVSRSSPTGYQEPVKLLLEAGITEKWDTFFFVGNHVGSISSLLHSDTDVAVAAEPLAQRWAKNNELSVVAVSDEVATGGWWIHRSVEDESASNCAKALEALDRSSLKALPAWIGGFRSTISSGHDRSG